MKNDLLKSTLLMLLVGGCGNPPPLIVLEQSKTIDQVLSVDEKIDILFVVDNSLSMENKQKKVAAAFKDFIEKFAARRLDYQVGVISTEVDVGITDEGITDEEKQSGLVVNTSKDIQDYWQGSGMWVTRIDQTSGSLASRFEASPYKNFWNEGAGSLLGHRNPFDPTQKNNIIKRDTKDQIAQFQENAKICEIQCVSMNPEQGLKAVLKAISPELNADGKWNKDFFRPDARLAIIIISDEDESLPIRPKGLGVSPYVWSARPGENQTTRSARVQAYINNFVSKIQQFKSVAGQVSTSRFYFAVVVNKSQASIDAIKQDHPEINPGAVGSLYIETAKRLNGLVLDIALDDYSKQLADFGDKIVKTLFEEIPIGQVVENQSLRVRIIDPADIKSPYRLLTVNDPNGYVLIPDTRPGHDREKIVKLVGKGIPTSPTARIDLKWIPKEAIKLNK